MPEQPIEPRRNRRRWRRAVLPVIASAIGVWLLVGCFYVPVPDQRTDKKQPDFRDMIGDAKSDRPIRPGAITRAAILAKLGPPPYVSKDGKTIAYTLETVRGAWIWPLCFHGYPQSQRAYALGLHFDRNDVLVDWKIVHVDESFPWLQIAPLRIHAQDAIDRMNSRAAPAEQVAATQPVKP